MPTKTKSKKTLYKEIAEQYKDWLGRYPKATNERKKKHFDLLADKVFDDKVSD